MGMTENESGQHYEEWKRDLEIEAEDGEEWVVLEPRSGEIYLNPAARLNPVLRNRKTLREILRKVTTARVKKIRATMSGQAMLFAGMVDKCSGLGKVIVARLWKA